jgi:hypothetical protein
VTVLRVNCSAVIDPIGSAIAVFNEVKKENVKEYAETQKIYRSKQSVREIIIAGYKEYIKKAAAAWFN